MENSLTMFVSSSMSTIRHEVHRSTKFFVCFCFKSAKYVFHPDAFALKEISLYIDGSILCYPP